MSKYVDDLVSLKTEIMMGPKLSTHKAMTQVLNQVRNSENSFTFYIEHFTLEIKPQNVKL